jgi:hypothetical protein
LFQAIGAIIKVAKNQRKKASITGGTIGEMLRAIIKLPDHITAANIANPTPVTVLLFLLNVITLLLCNF